MSSTRRFKLTLEYDGSEFHGWQYQINGRSVQGVVEAAFKQITGEDLRVNAAGRTDAAVHALGQVAHVDTTTRMEALELRKAINAVLPYDVGVRDVCSAAPDFDARRRAISKCYRYRILDQGPRSPLRQNRVWHVRQKLDEAAMRLAAAHLVGSHDFAAFRGARGGAPEDEHTRRDLGRLDIRRMDDEIHVEAEGRSFMRYMVRNLVGTLVDCGQGRRTPAEVAKILASRDRRRAGPTAPGCGLCLLWVKYPADDGAA
ncbi:MAG: tRNA pseudouridine(38-40) synthase TruA [bacterium]|nr:tRNA pseudouridine(38-40) synthase TruA [bacterium]